MKEKRKLGCWWFALTPILLIMFFLLQLLGPDPAIVVSPQTTQITTPLGLDGFPNYMGHLHARARVGVTAENNAAVLIWKATWPGELEPEHYELMCAALGMEIPLAGERLVSVLDESVVEQVSTLLPPEPNVGGAMTTAQDAWSVLEMAQATAWTGEQLPMLAQWAELNSAPLDLLVQAANRPRYYSPSPSFLAGWDDGVISMLLPGVQGLRDVGRCLTTRAMWHVGEERPVEAWRDLRAVHLIARHACKGLTLVEQLVGVAIESLACTGTQTLLHHGKLSGEQAKQMLADLNALPNLPPMAKSVDEGERLMFLDSTLRLATGKRFNDFSPRGIGGIPSLIVSTRIDWNVVLRKGNVWYDRLVKAWKQPRAQRLVEIDKIDQDLINLRGSMSKPARILGGIVSRNVRSEWIADMIVMLLVPALQGASSAEDRGAAQLEITRAAAALAVYRAANNEYPEKLATLVPVYLDSMSIDLYSGKPFLYERRDDGYLLYSVFENGADDKGTDVSGGIVNGEWITPSDTSIERSNSDLVVRLPRAGIRFRN